LRSDFVGIYRKKDVKIQRNSLEERIVGYEPQEFRCSCDPAIGEIDCVNNYVSWTDSEFECPEQTLRSAERDLSRLNMRQSLALEFCNPSFATANDFPADGLIMTAKHVTKSAIGISTREIVPSIAQSSEVGDRAVAPHSKIRLHFANSFRMTGYDCF
jgi:hypothetical protein